MTQEDLEKLINIMLEAHDLVRMAELTESHAQGMFVKGRNADLVVSASVSCSEQIRFATRDVRCRAEILRESIDALLEKVEKTVEASNG